MCDDLPWTHTAAQDKLGDILGTLLWRMFLHSFMFCCLGNVFFIAGAVGHMEILEERNIFKEFMKYPLNNPKKDLDLRVLSLHLRPSPRNKSTRNGLDNIEKSPHRGQTIQLSGRRKNEVTTKAKPKTNYKVPQSKRQQELEYKKLGKKDFKRKGRSKNHNKPRRPAKLMLESEEGEGYKEVKRKNLRSRRIGHFTKSWRNKQPKGKRQSVSWKVEPSNKEFQISELPENWGKVEHLALPPMIDGEVLSDDAPLTYNYLGGENYYNTQQANVLQEKDEKETQKWVIWDGSREHSPLDHVRHTKLKFFLDSGGKVTSKEVGLTEDHLEETESSLATIANKHFSYFPNGDAEQTSVIVLPTRNGVRDTELPPHNAPVWKMVVPTDDIAIMDIYPDTIQPAETHTEPDKVDNKSHLWSHSDILLQTEGSGRYNPISLDREDKSITLTPNKGSTQMMQEIQEFLLSQPTATTQQSSYDTSPSPTNSKYTEASRVTGREELLDGIFSPLEATMNHNPGPIYCKPGYKEYGGVCKSQCDIGGIYCGNNGQCVIVENIGAMCRCQQINSLCYGGECCRSSLTTFQLACVIGGCCILLSLLLGSLPFLIRRMDIKAISKSVRTSRLWISTLMPQSSTSLSSQSADTVCSDYEPSSDRSTFYRTKEMARNSTMWQCERTRL